MCRAITWSTYIQPCAQHHSTAKQLKKTKNDNLCRHSCLVLKCTADCVTAVLGESFRVGACIIIGCVNQKYCLECFYDSIAKAYHLPLTNMWFFPHYMENLWNSRIHLFGMLIRSYPDGHHTRQVLICFLLCMASVKQLDQHSRSVLCRGYLISLIWFRIHNETSLDLVKNAIGFVNLKLVSL